MTVASIIIDVAVQMAGQAAGGSTVVSLGVGDTTIANLGPANIFTKVAISSATFNAAAQSAFLASGGSLT